MIISVEPLKSEKVAFIVIMCLLFVIDEFHQTSFVACRLLSSLFFTRCIGESPEPLSFCNTTRKNTFGKRVAGDVGCRCHSSAQITYIISVGGIIRRLVKPLPARNQKLNLVTNVSLRITPPDSCLCIRVIGVNNKCSEHASLGLIKSHFQLVNRFPNAFETMCQKLTSENREGMQHSLCFFS